jgi:esterase/lipase superfamily enzyme
VVSVSGRYENDKFFGQIRDDNVYTTGVEVKYLPNRFTTLSIRHKYTLRASSSPMFNFDKHEVALNVTARF